jgi:xanthine dehydrogenase YagS FAD-binding subunit
MKLFDYARANEPAAAVQRAAAPSSAFIAGGTDLLNLMKDGIQAPDLVVDINALPLTEIRLGEKALHIGALARMSDVAIHPIVRRQFPVISQALLNSASPQVRNMASIGGNLLQRTRCWYFRDPAFPLQQAAAGQRLPRA